MQKQEKLRYRNPKLYLSKGTSKKHKWLAKIKSKQTLYLDDWDGYFTTDKPDHDYDQLIRKNTTIYIYKEDYTIMDCKYVGRLKNNKLKIGWLTLTDAIEDTDFDILEFTERCKRLYFKELRSVEE